MDPQDIVLIERLLGQDAELRRLWEEHQRLEHELTALRAHRFVTPAEEQREREVRKAKLAGRDRIERILNRYR